MDKYLIEDVSESKVVSFLSSMKHGKSPDPDGFTVDCFIRFYELLKKCFLLVVKESQKSGKVLGSFNSTLLCLIPKNQRVFISAISGQYHVVM
jgi:hypothetical protein